MSNYTKSTNFATKDNLSPGNPLKIVKGAEIDTEFNNIATAVATKTDNASAAITGGTITGITDLAVADGGTGASTATAALNNLLPSQTSNANKYLQTDGTNASWDAVSLSTADITGTLPVANGGTGVTSSTGTGSVVLSNSPTLVTPALGTPASGTATNLTGLPISTGVSGLGSGVATFLGTPSSANLASAVTDETGSGALVFANSPTLVTPALGTPSALVGTNITGTASGLTAGSVTTNANLTGAVTSVGNATSLGSFSSSNLAGALTDETGSGSAVFATSPTLVTPILGTPTSATLTNATGLPISTGVSGLGTGVATFLATPSSANLLSALTDETGTGVVVFSTSPTLVTPILGTPTSATLTNATGLPLTTGVTGQLPVANGGTGTATPSIVAGTNVTVTGTWPNQTIASSGGGGGGVAYTAVKTANYTAANNDGVLTNTTGGAFTVTLPSTPSVGNIVLVIDSLSQWGTNNLTIDPTGSIKIAGNTAGDTLVCDITGATVTLVYTGASYGWNVAAQVGGNGGTAVTLTGTQTLTNKTLTAPVLTTPNITTGLLVGGASGSAGNVLTSGGSGAAPTWTTPSGGFSAMDVLESGTSWTVPAGKTLIKIYVTGGGGGGSTSGNPRGAGGGGGTAIKYLTVTAGSTATIAIGGGGGAGNTGGTGGDTTFTYGGVTYTGNGGIGGSNATNGGAGGAGGSSSGTGALLLKGQGGSNYASVSSTPSYGAGGSSFWGGGADGNTSSSGGAYGGGGAYSGSGYQGVIVIEY